MNLTGSHWSEAFVAQFGDKEFRDYFVADQVRTRIAIMIRALREQRGWTQAELAKRMGTTQSAISRIEDADYGKVGIQTLLEVASACDLPLFVDIPAWPEWFARMRDFSDEAFKRASFDPSTLTAPREQGDFTVTGSALSGFSSQKQPGRGHLSVINGGRQTNDQPSSFGLTSANPRQRSRGLASNWAQVGGREKSA